MRYFLLLLLVVGCVPNKQTVTNELEGLTGSEEFKETPYITAGDRVYAIGSQDGSFPEIGWHIDKEMGGVWNHPIKLLDGFNSRLKIDEISYEFSHHTFENLPYGNRFYSLNRELKIDLERFQFVPDGHEGMVIEYELTNHNNKGLEASFEFEGHFDLRPTWLAERQHIIDGSDIAVFEEGRIIASDDNNSWFATVKSTEPLKNFTTSASSYLGLGTTAKVSTLVTLNPGETKKLSFIISGSYKSKAEAIANSEAIEKQLLQLLNDKKQRSVELEQTAKLTTSDPEFDLVFEWLKYNSDWFIREVPEIGRGIAAGYPDYPWWFGCDSEYALKGYLSIGQFEIVKSSIDLLANLSKDTNSNGRIVHEASTNGVVFNPGNINETPQFASLIWEAYKWTGDSSLLEKHFKLIAQGLDWLSSERDEDLNGYPEGAGMMEIHGLESEMIDVASYTQKGFSDAAKIAHALGDFVSAEKYQEKANQLKAKINDDFWVEDFDSYADFIASDEETLKLIEDAIVRADTLNKPWAIEELKQTRDYILQNPSEEVRPFVLHHNWVVNTPMEMGIATPEKAKRALKTAEKFVNPFGVFVTGIDRDESAGQDLGSFKGSKVFSYTGAVMTLPTGVSAVAENNYGNPNKALDYLKRMGRSFSFALPGSIYEVSPDYGMFAQAWNLYSYAVPTVQQFFGLNPNAGNKELTLSPLMPTNWKHAQLDNIKIGEITVSVSYRKSDKGYTYELESIPSDWTINFISKENEKVIRELKAEGIVYYVEPIDSM